MKHYGTFSHHRHWRIHRIVAGTGIVKARRKGSGVDNFATGRRENLAQILGQIDFREKDILDLEATKSACDGVDYILHRAAIPSVPKSVLDPIGSNRANVDGTVNVLVAARDAKVKRVVYAASSSAYGDTPTLPKHERMIPDPISPYAVAKLASEHYLTSFYRCYGLQTVALRYFNIFGPYQTHRRPTPACWQSSSRSCSPENSLQFLATVNRVETLPTSTTPSRRICWPAVLRQSKWRKSVQRRYGTSRYAK